ncbi:MAG: metabolite traffic protein EboE [Verrucomicrobiota bacterium]|nr:metabolite traffic protein EboE [Verrucomicrobiota bacterium]
MQIKNGIHLAYCTNIHRGEGWNETFHGLNEYTLKVKEKVSQSDPFAIGLRLGYKAALELSETGSGNLDEFIKWLDHNNCYIFSINGFPYGQFHGSRVKEQVYTPDWTFDSRVEYTNLLFDILAEILPSGMSGSVSTLPGSFKEFIQDDTQQGNVIIENLARCGKHINDLIEKTGKDLHLGLEPEPLGWFENTPETLSFFKRFRNIYGDEFDNVIGVNYDTCHLAIEYENAKESLLLLKNNNIKISKIHLSSALKLKPNQQTVDSLKEYQDDVYLHQVIAKLQNGDLIRFKDLPDAIENFLKGNCNDDEWRVHFHIPLHASPDSLFDDTRVHIKDTLSVLSSDPEMCKHLEMETYTWEVLPNSMQSNSVVDQLSLEYDWTLNSLRELKLF